MTRLERAKDMADFGYDDIPPSVEERFWDDVEQNILSSCPNDWGIEVERQADCNADHERCVRCWNTEWYKRNYD